MSQSRFVLKQIHVRGASGNSDLTRYISKSKLDHEREGVKARPLFSEHDDQLTAWEARKFLSITGGELRKDEVLHYVLSFEAEKDFESLGGDEETRKREVALILRASIRTALDSIGIAEMCWVAGVHRNTDNPHLHILFNKNAIEKETGELIQIPKLPSSLIAHHETQQDGSRTFSYGAIINSFAEQVDAQHYHRERARFLQHEIGTLPREVLEPKTLSKDLTRDLDKEILPTSINHTNEERELTKVQSKDQVKEQKKDQVKEKTEDQTRAFQPQVHLF